MGIYQQSSAGTIGSLLRTVAEDQQRSIVARIQGENAARRIVNTPPTLNPESVGSSQVLAFRPDQATAPGTPQSSIVTNNGVTFAPPGLWSGFRYGDLGGANVVTTSDNKVGVLPNNIQNPSSPKSATGPLRSGPSIGTKITPTPALSGGLASAAGNYQNSVNNLATFVPKYAAGVTEASSNVDNIYNDLVKQNQQLDQILKNPTQQTTQTQPKQQQQGLGTKIVNFVKGLFGR